MRPFYFCVAAAMLVLLMISFLLGSAAHDRVVASKPWGKLGGLLQPVMERFTLPRSSGARTDAPHGVDVVAAANHDNAAAIRNHLNNNNNNQQANAQQRQAALSDDANDVARSNQQQLLRQQQPQGPPGAIDVKHVANQNDAAVLRIASHMKYWNDATGLTRPGLWPKVDQSKYLVFQTWRGGFNNER